jgi:hypothetical protein
MLRNREPDGEWQPGVSFLKYGRVSWPFLQNQQIFSANSIMQQVKRAIYWYGQKTAACFIMAKETIQG